jgi:DNA-binding MarR family transcriptional regulator
MTNAMRLPDNVIAFKVAKRRPKIIEKEDVPHQKAYCITPFRAASDKNLHEQTLRVLMILCSYTNRAGITWVGQTTMAKQLGVHQQAISRQIKLLEKLGYLQVVSKGFKGERADTRRVIFDETVSTEDAIAIVSGQEDARPPSMVKEEMREMDEEVRQKFVKQAIEMSKGFGKANVFKVNTEPKSTDSITVREMKMKIAEHKEKVKRVAKVKREKLSKDADELMEKVVKLKANSVVKPVDNSVDNSSQEESHIQHHSLHLDVVQGDNNKVLDKVYIKELSNKLISIYKLKVGVINKVERVMTDSDRDVMLSLVEQGLTEELWTMIVDETLANCQTTRREPPHRIAYFKEAIQRVLNTD